MFQIEIFELLNSYKKGNDYEKEKIKASIKELIKQHKEDYKKIINANELDEKTKNFLKNLDSETAEKISEEPNDLEIIKNYYQNWLRVYEQNNRTPSEENIKIIDEIINFYLPNRFEILKKIIAIQETQDYEDFKTMLENNIRKKFSLKIKNYMESESFKSLSFFKKFKKEREIAKILNELGNYTFDKEKIEEVLK